MDNVDNKLIIFSVLSTNVLEYNVYERPNFRGLTERNS